MPKLKDLLPNIFGNNKESSKGRLETDALPVDDGENNTSRTGSGVSVNSTPTASAELTESVVRELSDPNYDSVEVAQGHPGSSMEIVEVSAGQMNGNNSALTLPSTVPSASSAVAPATMNTMNVHNAQQQLVMQFSNVNKLHFGSVYNFNSNVNATELQKTNSTDDMGGGGGGAAGLSPSGDLGKRQIPRKTTSIVAMMQSQEEPNHRMLDTIATHLGEGWKQVMRDLGRSEGQIEQALIDHQVHGGIKEVIYQLLLQWIRGADDNVATLGYITGLLWETNHRDCVQRMKLVWKAEVKRKTSS